MPKYTKSGKLTKLGAFEQDVSADSLPGGEREKYAIANKVGLMRGNKATKRGTRADKGGGIATHDSMRGANMHGREPRHTSGTR